MNADNRTPNGQINALNGSVGINSGQGNSLNNVLIGPGDDDYGRSTSASLNYDPYHPKVAVDVQVKEDTIEITYIQRAMYSYTTINSSFTIGGPQQQWHNPDKVFKEIYGVKDGKLSLLKTIDGRIIPPQLEESYEFPE